MFSAVRRDVSCRSLFLASFSACWSLLSCFIFSSSSSSLFSISSLSLSPSLFFSSKSLHAEIHTLAHTYTAMCFLRNKNKGLAVTFFVSVPLQAYAWAHWKSLYCFLSDNWKKKINRWMWLAQKCVFLVKSSPVISVHCFSSCVSSSCLWRCNSVTCCFSSGITYMQHTTQSLPQNQQA